MQGLDRRAGLRGVLAQGRHLLLGLASQGRQGLPLDQELLAGVLHEFPHRRVSPLGQGALCGLDADQPARERRLVFAQRVDRAHDPRQVPAELLAQHGVLRGGGEGRARQHRLAARPLRGRGVAAVHAEGLRDPHAARPSAH